jgi:SAM-dependent methyltransferase
LRAGNLRGEVLELACGTGFWTRHLAGLADRITALDGSVEMLAEARRRGLSNVDFRQQDLFHWQPRRHWDAVFFAHWLAHAPEDRFDPFWAAVRRAVSRTLRTGAAILANPVHGSSGVDPAGSGPRGGTRQAAWAGASVEPGAGLGDLQTDCAPTVGH